MTGQGLMTMGPNTYSNTEESCWSPHINISAILRKDSTNKPLLFSDTVVFFSKTLYKYFKWSNDRRFFGLFQPPPNQLRLRNISSEFPNFSISTVAIRRKLLLFQTDHQLLIVFFMWTFCLLTLLWKGKLQNKYILSPSMLRIFVFFREN